MRKRNKRRSSKNKRINKDKIGVIRERRTIRIKPRKTITKTTKITKTRTRTETRIKTINVTRIKTITKTGITITEIKTPLNGFTKLC